MDGKRSDLKSEKRSDLEESFFFVFARSFYDVAIHLFCLPRDKILILFYVVIPAPFCNGVNSGRDPSQWTGKGLTLKSQGRSDLEESIYFVK
jgi:hypothetical protein